MIISDSSKKNRYRWINKFFEYDRSFVENSDLIENELNDEIDNKGTSNLIDHLRLCGNIPECFSHDSTEEKLYSKYTDCLLSASFSAMGFKSIVLKERANVADVDVFGKTYSFVADAKAFRLSRTAKNQKDFKVQAMDSWKHGKPYAMVVCPIYQLPSTQSQIYQQATSRDVCIFTYTHLALIVKYASVEGNENAESLIKEIFKTIEAMNPSKKAADYWITINKLILSFSNILSELWKEEKNVSTESIKIAKEHDLLYLADERSKIMNMSHEEALLEIIKMSKIDSKVETINKVTENNIFLLK